MIELQETKALPTLMMWRQEVIRHVFGEEPSVRLLDENRRYYQKHIGNDTHFAIVAKWNGEDAGCGAVCFTDELPSPDNPTGRCAYLMNIYVRTRYRQHGIAHVIVHRLIDEARSKNVAKYIWKQRQRERVSISQ